MTNSAALNLQPPNPEDAGADHHFRKPANDITSQLEINFGDLGRPGRGRGGARGGRGGRGAGGGGTRPARGGGRSEKVTFEGCSLRLLHGCEPTGVAVDTKPHRFTIL